MQRRTLPRPDIRLAKPSLCLILLTGLALFGCTRPSPAEMVASISIMTDLPLFWGEGDVAELLEGGVRRAAAIEVAERIAPVSPLDSLEAKRLADTRLLVLAQPRRLGGEELVLLDRWVRDGGRLLLLADPMLVWPSRHPLGDPRRPPPVSLLDPLLYHWGIRLTDARLDGEGQGMQSLTGLSVVTRRPGGWRAENRNCRINGILARCRVGKGRVWLVADADWLDDRLWAETGARNEAALERLLVETVGASRAK